MKAVKIPNLARPLPFLLGYDFFFTPLLFPAFHRPAIFNLLLSRCTEKALQLSRPIISFLTIDEAHHTAGGEHVTMSFQSDMSPNSHGTLADHSWHIRVAYYGMCHGSKSLP